MVWPGTPASVTLKDIVKLGGGITVNAKDISAVVAKDMAQGASPQSIITFKHADMYPSVTLKDIARQARCKVVFDFEP